MPASAITSTTQAFLDIHDITNNLVFLRDGSATAILSVSAMNFSLLAEEEQDAVIYAYAALLNSLNFPIQINLQSKTKDATAYLELLRKQEETASTPDKRKRIAKYREFVSQLIQDRNVLDKKFYVVIPASAVELGIITPKSLMPGSKPFDVNTIERSVLLEKAVTLLEPRVDHLISQFNRIGLYGRQLATQEIIQIFYTNYNPEATEGQQITDSGDYTTPMVQASMFSASLQNRSQILKQFGAAASAQTALVTPPTDPTTQASAAPTPSVTEPAAPETVPADESPLVAANEIMTQNFPAPTTPVQPEIAVTSPEVPTPAVAPTASPEPDTAPMTTEPATAPAAPTNYSLPPLPNIT
jgi:hypothetical protein